MKILNKTVKIIKFKAIMLCAAIIFSCVNIFGQSITWQKVLINPGISYFTSVVQTPDEGYIAAGRHQYDENRMYFVRFNKFGDTLWSKRIDREEAMCIIKTNDNNYVISGRLGSFVKIDINGNILNIGAFFDDRARLLKVIQDSDSNYFMCGSIFIGGFGLFYPYLLKYNNSGELLWDSIYTKGIYTGDFKDFVLSNDNSLVITGSHKFQNGQPYYLFLSKIDFNGIRIWTSTLSAYNYLSPNSIIKIESGSYFISCRWSVLKFNSSGNFIWRQDYDTLLQNGIRSMTNTFDGKIVYTAYHDSGNFTTVKIRKIDTNGTELLNKNLGFENHNHTPWDIKPTLDSGYVVVGRTDFIVEDAYILKTNKNGELPNSVNIISTEIPKKFNLYQNYPNPFNPVTKIKFDIPEESEVKLRIYDLLGKELTTLLDQFIKSGTYEINFRPHNLSSGNYFYQLLVYKKSKLIYTKTNKLQIIK